jgi:uncharacterized membrane protein YsdA (DUF1294 family)/cold shock CspA family protein
MVEIEHVELPKLKIGDSSAVRTGKIVSWDSRRGFGWLECEGERLFVHLREFKGTDITPGLNVEFPFVVGTDVQGRPCAKGVSACLVNGKVKVSGWLLLAALLFWPLAGLAHLSSDIWWIPLIQMSVLSAVTYKLYEYDKRQARIYSWRVPQTIMQLAELAGGWPGAYIAQKRLCHKSSKKSYQSIFWGIILIYQVVGADLVFDNRFSKELWKSMGETEILGKI